MKKIIMILIPLISIFSCSDINKSKIKEDHYLELPDNVKNKIVKLIIEDDVKGYEKDFDFFKIEMIFISINKKDPSPLLLEIISKDARHNYKPISESINLLKNTESVKGCSDRISIMDKVTNKKGIAIELSIFKNDNDSMITVMVQNYSGPLFGSGETYRVKEVANKWVISSKNLDYVL